MLLRRLYYRLKPYLPWRIRIAMRRVIARRLRLTTGDIWPINQATSTPPAGWPGWPESKKFAVVLTHDVEGPEGLARCRELAELEQKLGFRSSFNFIPEGTYSVSPALRAWLTEEGFEVGVHDLHHDGQLYSSRPEFEQKATMINQYLRKWEARGFRSGFMLRNLDWLHALDIEYDCSTFDTDPFEPQPDAAGTIFPFWIAAPISEKHDTQLSTLSTQPSAPVAKRGYVELPYTLPQDSTLFLVHQEKSNAIWRDKLDWIASHGGMVLLNVHPDYLHLGGRGQPTALNHYQDLLEYLRRHYPDRFWNALPREVAGFVRTWHKQSTSNTGGINP